jgi:hypothetical protein
MAPDANRLRVIRAIHSRFKAARGEFCTTVQKKISRHFVACAPPLAASRALCAVTRKAARELRAQRFKREKSLFNAYFCNSLFVGTNAGVDRGRACLVSRRGREGDDRGARLAGL